MIDYGQKIGDPTLALEYRDNPQSEIPNPQSKRGGSVAMMEKRTEGVPQKLSRRTLLQRAVVAVGFVTGFLIGSRSGLIHASGSEIRNPQSSIRNPQSPIGNPQSPIPNPQSLNPQSAIRNPQSLSPQSAIRNPQSLSPQSAIRNPKSEYRRLFKKGRGMAG